VSHVDPDVLALLALGETAAHPGEGRHLPGCPACQQDLSQLSDVVSLARASDGDDWLIDPPPELWPRIAAEAGLDLDPGNQAGLSTASTVPGSTAPASPGPPGLNPASPSPASTVPAGPSPASTVPAGLSPASTVPAMPGAPSWLRRRPDRRWWQRPAAAAGAALIVGAGAALGLQHYRSAPPPTVTGRFVLRPLAQFPQWKGASGSAVIEHGVFGQSLKVMLRAPVRHGFYEVWLLARDGVKMISLGDLDPGHDGTFSLPPGVDLRIYTRVDVSLQTFNGNPVHSASIVVRGTLP
jgi:hypothetical protein